MGSRALRGGNQQGPQARIAVAAHAAARHQLGQRILELGAQQAGAVRDLVEKGGYIIRVSDRDKLKSYLGEQGIGTEIYYPVPLHLQQCFADLGYKAGDCPHSEAAAAQTVALPVYPELSEAQLQYVVDTIAAFYS
jgi:hypothetical protein